MLDEESRIRRATQGGQQAFAQLCEEHFNRIYRYAALRVGDRTVAENLTEESWVIKLILQ